MGAGKYCPRQLHLWPPHLSLASGLIISAIFPTPLLSARDLEFRTESSPPAASPAMATRLLRPQLLRSSKAAFECAFCAQRRTTQFSRLRYTSRLRQPISRSYATVNPGDPKPPQEDPEKKGKDEKDTSKSEKDSNQSQNEESKSKETGQQEFTQLSEEEVKQIQDLAQMMKMGLPKSQAAAIDEAVELMKKGGVPKELREVLEARRKDPKHHISLATTVRLVSVFTKLSRMSPEEVREKYGPKAQSANTETPEETPLFDQSNKNQDGNRREDRRCMSLDSMLVQLLWQPSSATTSTA